MRKIKRCRLKRYFRRQLFVMRTMTFCFDKVREALKNSGAWILPAFLCRARHFFETIGVLFPQNSNAASRKKDDKRRRMSAIQNLLNIKCRLEAFQTALFFPHRLRPLQNQISVAPAQAGAQCKAALCLSHAFLKRINFL